MFRRRADRIRGVSGSLDGATGLVVDAVPDPGGGIVRVLAAAGARVLAASADSAMLDVELSKLGPTPIPVGPIPADVTMPEDRARLSASVTDGVSLLIINSPLAGEVANVEPFCRLAREVADRMRDQGRTGAIVFVTGIDRAGPAGSAAAFVAAEMKDMAAEFAANAIRVNAAAVGPVGANRRGHARSSRATPLGHVTIHPIEVGKAVWFLLNDDFSSGVTGATLKIDRGASMQRPDW